MKVYDPDQCVIIFAGIHITGWADGEFISIESSSEAFKSVVGTDGKDVTRSKTNDRRGKVTFKLMQSSDVNLQLSALHNLDLNQPGGAGVGPFQMKDLQGTSIYFGAESWIVKAPNAPFDREAKSREWELEVAELVRVDGGN